MTLSFTFILHLRPRSLWPLVPPGPGLHPRSSGLTGLQQDLQPLQPPPHVVHLALRGPHPLPHGPHHLVQDLNIVCENWSCPLIRQRDLEGGRNWLKHKIESSTVSQSEQNTEHPSILYYNWRRLLSLFV